MYFLREISLLKSQQIRVILQHFWTGLSMQKKRERREALCDIDISDDAIPVVDQIWPVAQKIISESVRLMLPLLKLFGVG